MSAASPADLYARLQALDVSVEHHEHPAVWTVEEAKLHCAAIPGVHCKNLFLKDKKDRLWLVIAPNDRAIDLKTLPDRIGSARLSFGRAELLMEVLGVVPGAVTPFGLINDRAQRVSVVLDAWMMRQDRLNYHPLVNTATTTITPSGLLAFIRSCGHQPATAELA